MSETFQRPDKSFFQEPKELGDLVNKENIVHKYLLKQTDIDKILKVIQRKVLKGTHICQLKLKKYRQDTCIVPISRTYTYIYHKINYLLPRWQLKE